MSQTIDKKKMLIHDLVKGDNDAFNSCKNR